MTTARAHVLLLAHYCRDAFLAVVAECFRRVLQQLWVLARRRRRDRGRQVDEPFRIDGKPADDLKCGDRVLLAHGHVPRQPGGDDPLAEDIIDVEQLVLALLGGQRRGRVGFGQERSGWLSVGGRSGDAHEL